jgi:chemotaxis response regulator CheB
MSCFAARSGVTPRRPARGGLALAQSPAEAEFASMPASAIARNQGASVLDIDDIGRALNQFAVGKSYRMAS